MQSKYPIWGYKCRTTAAFGSDEKAKLRSLAFLTEGTIAIF